jgi:TPR repeat protein
MNSEIEKIIEENGKKLQKQCKYSKIKLSSPSNEYKMAKCLMDNYNFASKENRNIALQLYKSAASKGHADAAFALYILYLQEKRIEIEYLKIAVDNGNTKAQIELARLYLDKKNKKYYKPLIGFSLLKEALKKKSKTNFDYRFLAQCYETGNGTNIDLDKALQIYKNINTVNNMLLATDDIYRINLLIRQRDKKP